MYNKVLAGGRFVFVEKELAGVKEIMYNKKSIEDLSKKDLQDKKVLVRVDFNVPVDEKGDITDDKRIRAALPTIEYLKKNNTKIILVSHFGRPKGEIKDELRMNVIGKRLGELISDVTKLDESIGDSVKAKIDTMKNGEIILLENIRFHKGETKNDPKLAEDLAGLADLYVNDAFGTAHRAHASTEGVTKHLPAYAGFLIKKELEIMGKALANPERPFVAIIGGAKVSTKIPVLRNLLGKVDTLIIGGGMAYTFFKVMGYHIGNSLCEDEYLDEARKFLDEAQKSKTNVEFPVDNLVADDFSADANIKYVNSDNIEDGWEGVDIGKHSIEKFSEIVKKAKTVVWNGPMGVCEIDKFAEGTRAMAEVLSKSKAVSIIGGGDSAAAIEKLGFTDKITHVSTGGGASLEFLEGKELPGIAALMDKEKITEKV